ncbi:NUDIX hydrolase [Kitasatospora sp. NPDC001603]|uniref:NUDIX hydrolase n=1 Tax=Kitasatospora sp. NPDC001603 TaxID=3154388 RepID=UPI00332D8179
MPVPVRVCAVLLHDGRLALIRRQRPHGVQHTLPGGLVENGEDPLAALRRELLVELGLDVDVLPVPPVLRFVQEQEMERPGVSTLFPAPGLHRPSARPAPPHGRGRGAGRPGPGTGGVDPARRGGRPPPPPGRRPRPSPGQRARRRFGGATGADDGHVVPVALIAPELTLMVTPSPRRAP